MTHHRKNKPPREFELKLTLPKEAITALAEHPAFHAARQPEHRHQITTYFDTQDKALSHSGMSLRVRRTGDQRVQTLKADQKAGVVADRAEWEWQVEHDEPETDLLKSLPLATKLSSKLDLQPVFTTDINRTIRILERDNGSVVEAALDEGSIIAGETQKPVCELELELKAGEPASLFRLALELHATIPMTIESASKAERGYQIQTGIAEAAHKGDETTLRRKTSAAEAFQQIVGTELGHLLRNQPAARVGDAEGVHQMRIAIRRLRAALTLFQPYLEPHAASHFQAELRRVGQVFGEARDWDVFCQQVLPETLSAAGGATWHNLLQQPATTQRDAAHQHFVQELDAPSFTALVLGLGAWMEEPTLLGNEKLKRPIGDLSPRMLDRLAGKVTRRGRHIQRRSDTERHGLRKSLKKLRYSIDYLQTLFPSARVKPYLRRCKKLQQTLGDINDSVTAIALVEHLVDHDGPDLAPAAAALAQQLGQRRSDTLHSLSKRWKAFRTEPRFWS